MPISTPLRISSLSTVMIQVPVNATVNGVPNSDITSDAVYLAFTRANDLPATMDWQVGQWVTGPGPVYYAETLVGPGTGGLNLATGTWTIWVKIVDDPEIPVVQAGLLLVE